MNLNKVKKICVLFPNFVNPEMIIGDATRVVMKFKPARNVNLEMAAEMFGGDSGMQIGKRNLPHIEGFNCTFRNDLNVIGKFAMQFSFASSEEKKVMRLIERHGGKMIDVRGDMNQFGKEEKSNNQGHTVNYENINEIIGKVVNNA